MIQLISVHEPTEIQLAEWLKNREINFQQYSEQMNKLKPPIEIYGENGKRMIPNYGNRMVTEYAITAVPPPEKPSLIHRIISKLKK